MSPSIRWLVLFDIDGTLIQTGRAGVRGMNAAFERLYGVARALDGTLIAGRTDRGIVADVLRRIGREAGDDAIAALREAYLADLATEIARPVAAPSGILPGVSALLDALEARDDVRLGLLTGNFQGGARIKLGHFDLWRRFAFGAFGDDHADRRPLVEIAVDRSGVRVPCGQVIVIGDTPLDVDCARAYGARAIGVATGPYPKAALEDAGAHLVVDTLAETPTAELLWSP
jgi:phosphoglycolate phosphatase-like HAD superfamily hydrolase